MIRRSLLASAAVVLGAVAIAPTAFAQTVNVPFSGTVGGACTFGTVTPGTLGVGGSSTSPSALAGGFPGGVMGKTTVTCNQPSLLSVSAPVQVGGPAFTPLSSMGIVNSPVGNVSSGGGSMSIPVGNTVPLNIDMHVDKGSPLTGGTYTYNVTLTITP